ncbi:hypothetical protein F1188_10315 [Roseospira marina]|uniref:Pyridoxal-phosphate dependent enzyme n=1 Tax=Roseospira marina TaxID=140057 RepID=A0A5M6ICY0_9PROT|nr:hypothetical protein [Roseospira marina]KAA5605619.1 hypothetical protein F1188_10315 [Roseospira marina]MBB4313310.1 hypothetical protein [Roseospira marina]MBB5085949.1 hypothetical protein [Roseospira marina]
MIGNTDYGPSGIVAEIACAGCGSVVDPNITLGLRCPLAGTGDGVDHSLNRFLDGPKLGFPESLDRNPFVRYRTLMTGYHVGRRLGLTDDAYVSLVSDLSRRAEDLLGEPFLMAHIAELPTDSADLGMPVRRLEATSTILPWPTRGLFAILVHLATLEAAGHRAVAGRETAPLVTLGDPELVRTAVVMAQVSARPLHVVVPNPCPRDLLDFLQAARVTPVPADGATGAACRARFHQALREGGVPFTPYGAHALPARDGLSTLAYDIAEALHARSEVLALMVTPARGGALASALASGLSEAFLVGGLTRLPRLVALDTEPEAVLMGAMEHLDAAMGGIEDPRPEVYVPALRDAARDPDAVLVPPDEDEESGLRPWAAQPPDWLACLEGVIRTRGALVSIEGVDTDDDAGGADAERDEGSASLALSVTLEALREIPDRRPLDDDYEDGVALIIS